MSWQAELTLVYKQAKHRTYLSRIRHRGPLVVQKSFYPGDGDVLHQYLLHPPGGLVGGDHLEMKFQLESSAKVLLTTPSAGKLYRTPQTQSSSSVSICMGPDSSLYWLPLENIAFDGARHRMQLNVMLTAGARLITWDILCLGRPGAHESFNGGRIDSLVDVRCDANPILYERMRWQGSGPELQKKWGLAELPVMGNLYIFWPTYLDMDGLLGDLSEPDIELGGTIRGPCFVVRGRSACPIKLREKFWSIISQFHQRNGDASLLAPTIWNY